MSDLLLAASHQGGAAPLHEAFLFWILAPIAVGAALGMVFARSAVHAALLLAVVMLCLAAFYTAENAPFLAVVQVVVYAVTSRLLHTVRTEIEAGNAAMGGLMGAVSLVAGIVNAACLS